MLYFIAAVYNITLSFSFKFDKVGLSCFEILAILLFYLLKLGEVRIVMFTPISGPAQIFKQCGITWNCLDRFTCKITVADVLCYIRILRTSHDVDMLSEYYIKQIVAL